MRVYPKSGSTNQGIIRPQYYTRPQIACCDVHFLVNQLTKSSQSYLLHSLSTRNYCVPPIFGLLLSDRRYIASVVDGKVQFYGRPVRVPDDD